MQINSFRGCICLDHLLWERSVTGFGAPSPFMLTQRARPLSMPFSSFLPVHVKFAPAPRFSGGFTPVAAFPRGVGTAPGLRIGSNLSVRGDSWSAAAAYPRTLVRPHRAPGTTDLASDNLCEHRYGRLLPAGGRVARATGEIAEAGAPAGLTREPSSPSVGMEGTPCASAPPVQQGRGLGHAYRAFRQGIPNRRVVRWRPVCAEQRAPRNDLFELHP